MKYRKLISKYLSNANRDNSAQVAVALVAGLAAGAVISILFAPAKGSELRAGIASRANGIGNSLKESYSSLRDRLMGEEEQVQAEVEVPHFIHHPVKKRKSDIKDLIADAHTGQTIG